MKPFAASLILAAFPAAMLAAAPPVAEMTVMVVTLPGAATSLRSENVPAASTVAVPISRPVPPVPSTMATRWPEAIEVVRLLILAAQREDAAKVTVTVSEEVATYLNNKKRRELSRIEDDGKLTVQVLGREAVAPEHLVIECQDASGREVKLPVM